MDYILYLTKIFLMDNEYETEQIHTHTTKLGIVWNIKLVDEVNMKR